MLVRTRIGGGMLSRLTSLGGDDNDRLSVEIRGHQVEVTQSLANQVRDAMMATPGVMSAQISRRPGQPEMVVSVDRAKANCPYPLCYPINPALRRRSESHLPSRPACASAHQFLAASPAGVETL